MTRFRKTLIVDDDIASQFLLRVVLDELGLNIPIIALANGQEALEYIRQQCINENAATQDCPDWILLDINMPVMDGLELLLRLKALGQDNLMASAVTVVTSSNYSKDMEKAAALGVKAYLLKPITEEKLREHLENHFK
jgi:CheY-like chemotaxis protein